MVTGPSSCLARVGGTWALVHTGVIARLLPCHAVLMTGASLCSSPVSMGTVASPEAQPVPGTLSGCQALANSFLPVTALPLLFHREQTDHEGSGHRPFDSDLYCFQNLLRRESQAP